MCLISASAAVTGSAAAQPVQRLGSPLAGKRFDRRVDLLFTTGGYTNGTVVRAYGGRVHQLSRVRFPVWNPIASSNRKWIVFGAYTPGDQPTRIGVMHADGKGPRIIPHTANCYPGGWAPNGSWIAAGCGISSGSDVNLVELDVKTGAVVRHLGKIPPGESPSVSRTSGTIALADMDDGVYTVNPTSGARMLVAHESSPALSVPAWSPDGHTLAFFDATGTGGELKTVNTDGSNLQVIRRIRNWPADFVLTYSANGRYIAYGGSSDRGHDLYLINSSGKGLTRLTRIGTVGEPSWMPKPHH